MKCLKCGREIEENEKYCEDCKELRIEDIRLNELEKTKEIL